jgi:exonuclease SbcC
VRLTGLSAKDFMGYADLDLDLSATSQIAITGKNGSGKSAILDAIRWCLFGEVGREISSKDLIIRDGADSAYVKVAFDTRSQQVFVEREKQRGRTAALTLTVDGGQATRHTIAETEAAIVALVGLDADALMAGPFMEQETAAAFMKARPADRKDLLARLFGLDRYDAYWRAATDRHKEAKAEAGAARQVVATADATLEGESAALLAVATAREQLATFSEAQSLASTRRDVARDKLAEARTRAERHAALTLQRDNLAARLQGNAEQQAALTSRLRTAQTLVERAVAPFDAATMRAAEDALEAARAAAGTRDRLITQLQAEDRAVGEAERHAASLRAAREKLATVPCGGEGIYATCRFLTDAPTEKAVRVADGAVVAASAIRTDVDAQIAALPTTDTREPRERVDQLRAQMDAARREESIHAGAKATVAEGERAMRALMDSASALVGEQDRVTAELQTATDAQGAVAEWHAELQAAESTYAQVREGANTAAATVRVHEQALAGIDAAKAVKAEWGAKVVDLDALTNSLGLLAEAFHRDGIPTSILSRGIPLIEGEANRILGSLPGEMSIALRTQRAKATGGMAETLDVVVNVGGWEREYGLLSIGMRFRVDLAIRLALARVLTHRSGATIETLWLDEPLAALDVEGRQAVMETLGALATDFGLIVVVSHHPDFNDAFGARIDVEQVDGVSTARIAA